MAWQPEPSDSQCDHCARITRRARSLWFAKGIQLLIVLVVYLLCYAKIKGLGPN